MLFRFISLTNGFLSLLMSGMAAANTSFYFTTGAEIHWIKAKSFKADAAAFRTLLSGLTGFLIAEGLLLTSSWFLASPIHQMTGGILHVWAWPFRWLLARLQPCLGKIANRWSRSSSYRQRLPDPEYYEQIAVNDLEDDDSESDSIQLLDSPRGGGGGGGLPMSQRRRTDTILRRVFILGPFCLFLLLRYMRPYDPVYMYLSSALTVSPFFDMSKNRGTPVDTAGLPQSGKYDYLKARSSMQPPPYFEWLSGGKRYQGFEDWDERNINRTHYTPEADPLRITNLGNPVFESIRDAVANHDVQIKHVIVVKLESTRSDVFPIRKDNFIWNRIAESYKQKRIPDEVQERIHRLTSTAEYLSSSEPHNSYGGISAKNAITTGTYTLKSVVGTLCGVTPLVADFNREYRYHIYQPCLSHIMNAMSDQADITRDTDDFTRWPWHSSWMQSVTDGYDNQDKLTPLLGFRDVITREALEKPTAKHYPVKSKEVNYYGYPDTELRDYISDAIDDAERTHTRLFLTHLTGTTHHPWGMPNNTYQQLMAQNDDLNRYLNTIGFEDSWIAYLISMLWAKGVADKTLLVLAGDQYVHLFKKKEKGKERN